MNADVPCQTRYGKISTAIFPVGQATAQKLSDAIGFITDPGRRDKTWSGVPNGFRSRSDLLIVYLAEEPESDIPIVGLFADVAPDPALELAMYESRTANICSALRLLGEKRRDIHVHVIALSAIDKARKQVVFSGRYSADGVLQAREKWLAGAGNVPRIAVPIMDKKSKETEWRAGYQPSLYQAMESFKRQWLRAGETNQTVPGVDLGRIYDLFLEPDPGTQSVWLLDRYVPLPSMIMWQSLKAQMALAAHRGLRFTKHAALPLLTTPSGHVTARLEVERRRPLWRISYDPHRYCV